MNTDKISQKLQKFFDERKRMPSLREIANLLGFRSKNAAVRVVDKLLEAGFVGKDETGKLVPGRMFRELRVLGTVEAGFPSPAEEELLDTMSLDEFLIKNREKTFMLKVKGDSMIEAGIMPGDMVLVERGKEARPGDIVIAEVDREWTMKYLQRDCGKTVLLPANSKYPPIVPKEELKIGAIVKAVIRRYA